MLLYAEKDIYGNMCRITSHDLRKILDLLDNYAPAPYLIREIRQDDINDPNGRIDIIIEYTDPQKGVIRQKLLILKEELIDGVAFHQRRAEWYPNN